MALRVNPDKSTFSQNVNVFSADIAIDGDSFVDFVNENAPLLALQYAGTRGYGKMAVSKISRPIPISPETGEPIPDDQVLQPGMKYACFRSIISLKSL